MKNAKKYSALIVLMLQKLLHYTPAEIAEIVEKTPSFVSHVKQKRRTFSEEDLEKLEEKTGFPVFWFYLQATPEKELSAGLRNFVSAAKSFCDATTMTKLIAKDVLDD